jgi:hypothetical protein
MSSWDIRRSNSTDTDELLCMQNALKREVSKALVILVFSHPIAENLDSTMVVVGEIEASPPQNGFQGVFSPLGIITTTVCGICRNRRLKNQAWGRFNCE